MQQSTDVAEALARFCAGLSAGDVGAFDDLVSSEAALVVGTAPGETIEERERMRFGFEAEGVTLTPRSPRGYEEGSMGWAFDEPDFGFPDGSGMRTRMTSVWRREDGSWRLVHAHFSVGVPDDEVVELQRRWSS
jgi:ketosteroid isomerase-like protein